MYNDYGNENRNYANYGNSPPEQPAGGWVPHPAPESFEQGTPMGAPAERTDAPVPERMSPAPRRFHSQNLDGRFAPRPDEWRDPIYSQTHETTSDMYSPGICVSHPPSRKHGFDIDPVRKERRRRRRLRLFTGAISLVLVCAILSGAVAYMVMEYRLNRGDFTPVNHVVLGGAAESQLSGGLAAPMPTTGVRMSAEDIYTMACTQVVSIATRSEEPGSVFGGMVPGGTSVAASGFIISSDGYILTNFHVVESAYNYDLPLIVSLIDGTEYEAQVVGFERNNDVAVIKIPAVGLNPVVIADSDSINVGQTVYAVGNPLGEFVYTMTEGIVSARDREVSVEGKTINTFQFSAAVNSGNSGGPLYDTNGEVIGIVTAKPMRNSVEGIGFAIPINDAVEIAAELIEHGYITGRPFMGITPQNVTRAHAEYWEWVVGVYVRNVFEGSAAEKAGMQVGDIITELGDAEIDSTETLVFTLRRYRAGDTTSLMVWRSGDYVELTITFDEDLSAGQARQQPREP